MTRGKRPLTLDALTVEQHLTIARQESRALREFVRVGRWPTVAPLGASGIGRGELRTDVDAVAEATRRRNDRKRSSMTWQDRAACKGATKVFYPPKGGLSAAHIARAVCAGCPVVEPCLEDALDRNEQHGIWAGRTVRELRVIRRQRREAAA